MFNTPDEMVRDLHMTPAKNLEEAIQIAEKMLNNHSAKITAIPDGVAVMVI